MPLKRFLIAESEPEFSNILKTTLEKYQINFEICGTGKEFFEKISDYKPDLMILSVELPDQNGFALCKKIKEDNTIRGIPLVITVSQKNAEAAKSHQRIRTRADAYFIKPINVNNFIGYIEELLGTPLKKKLPTEPVFKETQVAQKAATGPEFKRVDAISERKEEKLRLEKELLEKEVKALREEVQILKSKVDTLIDEKGAIEDSFHRKEAEIKRERMSLEAENRKLKDALIEKDIDFKNSEKKMKEEIERLKAERDEAKRKIEENNLDFQRKEKQILLSTKEEKSRLEDEINKKTMQLKKKLSIELERRLKELEVKLSTAEDGFLKRDNEYKNLLKEISDKDRVINSYEMRVKNLEAERDVLNKRIKELEDEKKVLDNSVRELEDKLGSVKTEMVEEKTQKPEPVEVKEEVKPPGDALDEDFEFPLKYEEEGGEVKEESLNKQEEGPVNVEPEKTTFESKKEGAVIEKDKEKDKEIEKPQEEFEVETEEEQFSDDSALTALDKIFVDKEDKGEFPEMKVKDITSDLTKYVEGYNSIFNTIFSRVKEKGGIIDVQSLFNDYFKELINEGKAIFAGIEFNTNGELDAFTLVRNAISFIDESGLPEKERGKAAMELIQHVLMDLIEFMFFTAMNVLPKNEGRELKRELLPSVEKMKTSFNP